MSNIYRVRLRVSSICIPPPLPPFLIYFCLAPRSCQIIISDYWYSLFFHRTTPPFKTEYTVSVTKKYIEKKKTNAQIEKRHDKVHWCFTKSIDNCVSSLYVYSRIYCIVMLFSFFVIDISHRMDRWSCLAVWLHTNSLIPRQTDAIIWFCRSHNWIQPAYMKGKLSFWCAFSAYRFTFRVRSIEIEYMVSIPQTVVHNTYVIYAGNIEKAFRPFFYGLVGIVMQFILTT